MQIETRMHLCFIWTQNLFLHNLNVFSENNFRVFKSFINVKFKTYDLDVTYVLVRYKKKHV